MATGSPPNPSDINKRDNERSTVAELIDVNYATLTEVTGLVSSDSPFYGKALLVGQEKGYAYDDGCFRTTEDNEIGLHDSVGRCYVFVGQLERPYGGDHTVLKSPYHRQLDSLVSADSQFFDFVLVDEEEEAGYASTSGNFVTEEGKVVGSYEAATGIIKDDKEQTVGKIQDFRASGIWVANGLLNDMPPLVVASRDYEGQTSDVVSKDHVLYGHVLFSSLEEEEIVAFARAGNTFRTDAGDVVAFIRETGIIDINGRDIPWMEDEEGDAAAIDINVERHENSPQHPTLEAIRHPFSNERNELPKLVLR